jgi:Leucine Rich repeat
MGSAAPEWLAEVERVLREGKDILGLTDVSLSDAGAVEVAEKLHGSAVIRVYLGGNAICNTGAAALAELLRDDGSGRENDANKEKNVPPLEFLQLATNGIGSDGIAALADALRNNTTLKELRLNQNPGVDASISETESAIGIDSLVSAIGVNTTLKKVVVGTVSDPNQKRIYAALADVDGRRLGREKFLTGPLTKAARARD